MLSKTKAIKNLTELSKKRSIKTTSPLKRDWLFLLLGIIAFVAIAVLIRIFNPEPSEISPQEIKIDIKSKNTNNENNNFDIDECDDDCEKLTIRNKNNEIVFEEYLKGDKGNHQLRGYLVAEAKKGDRQDIRIKLPRYKIDEKDKRLVDISLDISNSVVTRDKNSVIKKAENTYSDLVFQKMKNYLREPFSNRLLPNDTINVRYYGPDFRDNPCNNKLVIKYTESEWDANIVYAKKSKQILIELGDKLPSETKEVGNEITTNGEDVIYQKIKEFWKDGINNPNPLCHSGTYLISHLTQISNDTVNKKEYSNYEFVLVTDGEFALSEGDIYVSPKNYDMIISYLNNKKDKEFIINGYPICKHPSDRFTIIGMEYDNNFSYRQTVQQFYQELLKSCQVVFENF